MISSYDMKRVSYTFREHLKESLKDPEFKKLWEKPEVEYILAEEIIKTRIKCKLSQRALAKKLKTSQAAISRIETMSGNPSLSFLKRIAEVFNTKLILKFE